MNFTVFFLIICLFPDYFLIYCFDYDNYDYFNCINFDYTIVVDLRGTVCIFLFYFNYKIYLTDTF